MKRRKWRITIKGNEQKDCNEEFDLRSFGENKRATGHGATIARPPNAENPRKSLVIFGLCPSLHPLSQGNHPS